MSDKERHGGTRDLTYSNWHRAHSISRFVGGQVARTLTMIDLDGLEYCHRCYECVGVIEVARDVGQFKPSTVTRKLALRLGRPGLLVLYKPHPTLTVTDGNGGQLPDIESFRLRVLAPDEEREFRTLTPAGFARWIAHMHSLCACRIVEAA